MDKLNFKNNRFRIKYKFDLTVIVRYKIDFMNENEIREFSWPGLFLVTGFCFFVFSLVLNFLNGEYPYMFNWISLSSASLGVLSWLGKSIPYSERKDIKN